MAPSPYASFAFANEQALIDFAYRAVHVTANASKTLVKAYYGKLSGTRIGKAARRAAAKA